MPGIVENTAPGASISAMESRHRNGEPGGPASIATSWVVPSPFFHLCIAYPARRSKVAIAAAVAVALHAPSSPFFILPVPDRPGMFVFISASNGSNSAEFTLLADARDAVRHGDPAAFVG